jgi:hypothetical protein
MVHGTRIDHATPFLIAKSPKTIPKRRRTKIPNPKKRTKKILTNKANPPNLQHPNGNTNSNISSTTSGKNPTPTTPTKSLLPNPSNS